MTDEELRSLAYAMDTMSYKERIEALKARDAAVRVDQMTEDLGVSHESIRINREELTEELRREDGKN